MAIEYYQGLYPPEFSASEIAAVELERFDAARDFDTAISEGSAKWHSIIRNRAASLRCSLNMS
jgi:hypothetical protein